MSNELKYVIFAPHPGPSVSDFAKLALHAKGPREFCVIRDLRDAENYRGLNFSELQVYFLWARPHPFTSGETLKVFELLDAMRARIIVVTDW